MAGPYDYTINIPQPPAQNFIQNLTGIMQLRQMQEQGAIQQQQAAFQQQMQPLQLQAEQARIGQIGQATAAAAEAFRQGKIRFEQEQQDRTRGIEQQAAAQARQNELYGRLTSMPADAPMGDVVKIANELALIKPEMAKQVVANFQTYPEQFQKAAETTLVTATTQLQSDDIEGARKTYADFAEAVKNSGAKNNPQLQSLVNSAEAQAKLLGAETPLATNIAKLSSLQLLGSINPKALDSIVALEKTQAEGAISSAKQKQVDEEKRALDLEKERLQIQEIQQKLEAGRSDKVKIYASQNKEGYKLNEEARNATLQAEKARGILSSIDSGEVELPKSPGASVMQWVRDKVPFLSNDISFLRTQYQALLAPEAKKNLPPGSASDADMRAAREGLLNKNATPKQFRKAVEIIARLSEDQAKYAEARLGWISENEGSIGTAVKNISVFGVPVKKGTPLNAWWTNVGKDLDLNKLPAETVPAPTPAAGGGAPVDVESILRQFGVKK